MSNDNVQNGNKKSTQYNVGVEWLAKSLPDDFFFVVLRVTFWERMSELVMWEL